MKQWIVIGALGLLGAGILLSKEETPPATTQKEQPVQADSNGNARGRLYENVPFSSAYTAELMSDTRYPIMPKSVVGMYCAHLPLFEKPNANHQFKTRWQTMDGYTHDNPLLMESSAYQQMAASKSGARLSRPAILSHPLLWLSLSDMNKENEGFFVQTNAPCAKPGKSDPAGNRFAVLMHMDADPVKREAFEVVRNGQVVRPTPEMVNILLSAYNRYTGVVAQPPQESASGTAVEIPTAVAPQDQGQRQPDVNSVISSQ